MRMSVGAGKANRMELNEGEIIRRRKRHLEK
jgi:hypothetical protein